VTPKLLVFDLDGTLIDTMADYGDHAARLMEAAFGTPFDAARRLYFETSGLPFEKQLKIIYPDAPDTDVTADQFEAWKDSYLLTINLPKATHALLAAWRARGMRVVISSNNLETYVQRMAVDWPVDVALGYRPVDQFGKGEPHFAWLEAHFSVSRADMLFVGDSLNDARIAARCKVTFRALLTPEFTADDFSAVDRDIVLLASLADLDARLDH
jgi:phosphoglycolate phosphatase-like HAD superfamily hydrolase